MEINLEVKMENLIICVCGGTNPATDKQFYASIDKIAKLFCENNVHLIWGGNAHGVLSVIYEEYVKQNKPHTLIVPEVYKDDLIGMDTDNVITQKTISGRTDKMFDLADYIIFVPGGIGTVYEFWTALEEKRANVHDAKIILYNYNNFFKYQIKHFNFINEYSFTKTGRGGAPYKVPPSQLFTVARNVNELKSLLFPAPREVKPTSA
jgi:predicted Rossmann-fold nucleotide-binding protein